MTRQVSYGPRLSAHPTGALRAALLVAPPATIGNAPPLPGEPNAVYGRAKLQLEIFAKTLRFFGCAVTILDPAGREPMQSAAADIIVPFEDGVAVMRPHSLGRRPEIERLEHECARLEVPVAGHLTAPGSLSGSDVLLAGRTAFIGSGARSNALGRSGFAELAHAHGFEPVEIAIPADIPLRALATAVSADTVVLSSRVAAKPFKAAGFETIELDPSEDRGAGVLCIGDRHVLADVRYSRSVNLLRRRGVVVEAIDLYDYGRIGITPAMIAIALKRV